MNYTELNDDPIDIPKGFSEYDLRPLSLYDVGMHDRWFGVETLQQVFKDEYERRLYEAGRRNAELILATLRANF